MCLNKALSEGVGFLCIPVPGVLWAQLNCGWGGGQWQLPALDLCDSEFCEGRKSQCLTLTVAFSGLNVSVNFTFPGAWSGFRICSKEMGGQRGRPSPE